MRVGFFGQTGPFAPTALRYLLSHERGFELALVVEGKRHRGGHLEHRLRKARPGPLPEGEVLGELGRAAGVPVLETADVNAPTAVRTLEEHELDWIVCVGFDRLFSAAVLATARGGALNTHPSLLPRWRGPSPLFWAVKEGERRLGITLHAIDAREDHGAIYRQVPFVAPHGASGGDLYRLAASVAGPLLVDALESAAAGSLVGTPQDDSRATRAPRPGADDVRLEPDAWGCERVFDFCCAAPFFRAPWVRFGDQVFLIRRGLAAEPGRSLPGPYAVTGTELLVRCTDGLARLEIQV